ncbi:MAG: hypothetical protein ACOCRK_11485, partial [bacterium]
IPEYISKAFARYRFNKEDDIIQKQCCDCKKWFSVLKLKEDKFVDMHNEEEIHLRKGKSGFESRCKACTLKKEEKIKIEKLNVEKNEKYSLYLKRTNKKYLEEASMLRGITIAEELNEIIENEMNRKPIEKLLEQFIKRMEKDK